MTLPYQYFLIKPAYWIGPWILQSIAYFLILGKMGLKRRTALIPFLAEREFSTVLFRGIRSFWRPFIISAVFICGAYYLGPDDRTGNMYMTVAVVLYSFFLLRLYHRLAKSFGKGFFFALLIWIFPLLGLAILALGRSKYTAPVFKPYKDYGKVGNKMVHAGIGLISAAEIIALVFGVAFITLKAYPPKMVINSVLNDVYDDSKDIVSDDRAITRETAMGSAASDISKMTVSRDKFFPDHSNDKSVVVMEYIVGSDLEKKVGAASANIRMMQDATKKGDALTFVLETGGSRRWFTKGMDENSYGRYTVKDGEVEKIEDRDIETMEEPSELEDFIKWTAKNYPADRYMLVLWDHGGGVPYGYGVDDLKHREDEDYFHGLRISEIETSIKNAGVKFDVIGFDACLMQDIEIANAMEPYADYYLASEETEGGFGWFYTDAFGRLAENPGLSSEEFGKVMVSTYDQFNTAIHDGKKQTDSTLSFVDLTLLKPAYEKVTDLFVKADKAIRKDPSDFADFGLAAMNSYTFYAKSQTDLIDFIDKLDDTDVDDSICSQKERDDLMNLLRASVLYRNRNAAKGINGLSFALAYEDIYSYGDTAKELDKMKLSKQRNLFNDVFSIIAVQKKREHDKLVNSDEKTINTFIESLSRSDFSDESWYVKGFEDYDPVNTLVDIPLKDTGDGYLPELPEKTWNIIADCQTAAYQKDEEDRWRYLGAQHYGGEDADGHPLVDMDDSWVHMNGRLICYESQGYRETDEGLVFTGDARAKLNGVEEILIHIEWDPIKGDEAPEKGIITGYDYVKDKYAFMKKGVQKFESGDRIDFLFDYYDDEGNLADTGTYGRTIVVTKQDNLKVEEKQLDDCDIEFLGILTDVYQRDIMTEVLEAHIGD